MSANPERSTYPFETYGLNDRQVTDVATLAIQFAMDRSEGNKMMLEEMLKVHGLGTEDGLLMAANWGILQRRKLRAAHL